MTQEKVHICMDVPKAKFKFEHFRHMCILSGCDYLESLPKIGLTRAKKIISALLINGDTDIIEVSRTVYTLYLRLIITIHSLLLGHPKNSEYLKLGFASH